MLGGVSLLGPPTGTDLAAALTRERFARQAGLTPVDLSWYAGTVQFGYSLLGQYVSAVLGSRLAQCLATVVAAYALGRLLEGSRRPGLGALAGAVCLSSDLLTGRTAYAIGLALGLLAVLSVERWASPAGAGLLSALSAAASPVAALFTGLAGVALVLTGRRRDGAALAVGAAVPLVLVGLVFGQGGDATIRWHDVWTATVLSAAVALAVRAPVVRVGALLTVLGLLAALVVTTPVGHNADRLVVLLAVPLVLAAAPWQPVLVLAAAVALVYVRPPLEVTDLRRADAGGLSPALTAPVAAELARRAPTGRVEAVPLREHGEALRLSAVAPLARGWLRQVDTERAALFYDGTLSATTYAAWLRDNGVQYVALADTRLDGAGVAEGALVRAGLPYLRPVWSGGAWTLYEVAGDPSLADGAAVVSSTPQRLVLRVDAPGDVLVRVRPSRWLTLSGPGCLAPDGGWLRLRARAPGTYVLSSRLQLRPSAAC